MFTPNGGESAWYGSDAANAYMITGIKAGLRLVPAEGEAFGEHLYDINNIYAIFADADAPYFQVSVVITGVRPARFGDTYQARLILLNEPENEFTCEPYGITVNDLLND